MDGANVRLERTSWTSRSGKESKRKIFSRLKPIWSNIRMNIDDNFSVFAEWLEHMHNLHYTHLPDNLMVFAARYNLKNEWLSWAEVQEITQILDLTSVPVGRPL